MTDPPWLEVGDRVFARRYAFLDQQIGAILTDDGPVIVDTRSTAAHARELLADLRLLTDRPVAAVINSHHHWDHAFGNAVFRPAPIWGHVRCSRGLLAHGEAMRTKLFSWYPELADDLRATTIEPPDRTFEQAATLEIGGRAIELRYLGRGHTDNDIVVVVGGADVLFAGDLLENDATPWFGDAYPLDWPATAAALRTLTTGAVVPGHGSVADASFVERQVAEFQAIADLAGRVHRAEISLDDAVTVAPYPVAEAREPLERALAQLRGAFDESGR